MPRNVIAFFRRSRWLLAPVAACTLFLACRTVGTRSWLATVGAPSTPAALPEEHHDLRRQARPGDVVEVPVDSSRKVAQVSARYSGRYRVKEVDADGQVRLTEEGQPRYKDGVYASAYLIGEEGEAHRLPGVKFVDQDEDDHWLETDIGDKRASRLRLAFQHAEAYAEDPEVLASDARIELRSVTVRYAEQAEALHEEFVYSQDDQNALDPQAIVVADGGVHTLEVDARRKLYRIDVRWGDAKPGEAPGKIRHGRAAGTLLINGKVQGDSRNVGANETQIWAPLDYRPLADDNKIEIRLYGDAGRIHWLKVYYEP